MILKTARLTLRCWQDSDRDDFAAMNADPEVMADLGGPFDRAKSDAKFDRYVATFEQNGFGRWLLEDADGRFAGYVGIMPVSAEHALGTHVEIGWRLVRSAWGRGYATEAAKMALQDGFERLGLAEVLSYTSADNVRSQGVMRRLDLKREPHRDFSHSYDGNVWHGLVWAARQLR